MMEQLQRKDTIYIKTKLESEKKMTQMLKLLENKQDQLNNILNENR